MDVIKITDSNLVVIMTEKDMTKYSISAEEIEVFGARAKGTLRRILSEAAAGAEFDLKAGAFVQVFSSKKGGCEMFVTSISPGITIDETDHYLHTVSKYIYRFQALDALLSACKALEAIDITDGGTAYADKEKNGRYFLELLSEAPSLCEFGAVKLSERDGTACYLSEHCRVICTDAVAVLGSLA